MRWGEYRESLSKFDNYFINLTMTYRSDSSIYYPFPPDLKSIIKQGKAWVDKRMAEKSNLNVSVSFHKSRLMKIISNVEITSMMFELQSMQDRVYFNAFNIKVLS